MSILPHPFRFFIFIFTSPLFILLLIIHSIPPLTPIPFTRTNKSKPLEKRGNRVALLLRDRLRHLHRNRNVQISLLRGEIVHRHSLSLDLQHLPRLRHAILSKLHRMSVQMRYAVRPAQQRVLQRDLEVHLQIVPIAGEHAVFALLQHHDDVPGVQIRMLVALVLKHDLLAILHTTLDIHADLMRLRRQLPAVANVAHFIEDLTLATTFRAGLLHLLNKTRSQLDSLQNDTRTLAGRAGVDMIRIVRSCSVAVLAELLTVDVELLFSSVVEFFQGYGNSGLHVLVSLSTTAIAKTKDIKGIETMLVALLFSLLKALFAFGIVGSSLILVRESVVRSLNIFISSFALLRFALIRVILQTQLSICFFNLGTRGLSTPFKQRSQSYLSTPNIL